MTPEKLLRTLIRESLLQEGPTYVSHTEVVAAIDNALRPERLNVDITGFRDLMIETAVVESGLKDKGQLVHTNEQEYDVRGIFQLTSIALKQLRDPMTLRQIKGRLDASDAMKKSWDKQLDADIFGSVKLQAMAACMYALWAYYAPIDPKAKIKVARRPPLNTIEQRADFWDKYYDTASDKKGTPAYYINKIKELMS